MKSFKPNSTQGRLMLRLLVMGEEPQKSKVKPKICKKDRDALVSKGLIREEKRGRAGYLLPTDRAWAWASKHLNLLVDSTSHLSAELSQSLIEKIAAYLKNHDIGLAEFVAPSLFETGTSDATQPVPSAETFPEDLEAQILSTCQELQDETLGGRIRISMLRERFAELPKGVLDETLITMQRHGSLVLNSLEGFELAPEDSEAAIDIAGEKRHLAYLR